MNRDPNESLILSVDDTEANRYVRGRVLRRAGYNVIDATSGEDGIRFAQQKCPDLILLDVKLPDINGDQVCKRIRENPATRSITILQISAKATAPSDIVHGFESGADSYLVEPIDPDVLVANVRALLRMRHAEEQLAVANRALRARNDELQRFAYLASHDLQEPLRTVHSYAQLLQRNLPEGLEAPMSEYFQYILDGAQRMRLLIDDLLAYSQVSLAERAYDERVDVGALLFFTLAALDGAVRDSQGVITIDEMPVIRGNGSQIGQLFQNLLSNALKYRRPEEPPKVHISAVRTGKLWEFSVRDNGMGIDATYFDRIFEPFKRLHGREYPGTGIGLALCRRIVESHRGTIWLESEVGKGSTFHFTVPAVAGE